MRINSEREYLAVKSRAESLARDLAEDEDAMAEWEQRQEARTQGVLAPGVLTGKL